LKNRKKDQLVKVKNGIHDKEYRIQNKAEWTGEHKIQVLASTQIIYLQLSATTPCQLVKVT
jgi:hypothetical protein